MNTSSHIVTVAVVYVVVCLLVFLLYTKKSISAVSVGVALMVATIVAGALVLSLKGGWDKGGEGGGGRGRQFLFCA